MSSESFGMLIRILFAITIVFSSCGHVFAQENAYKIEVFKSQRVLNILNSQNTVIKTYKIALGGNPKGPKTQEGDKKTPEGLYKIASRNEKSGFHRALKISYPNSQDTQNAKKNGVSAGGDIMIHGMRNGLGWIGSWHRLYDTWTNGCIAVTDSEIEEIWALIPNNTPIEIHP